MTFKIGQTWVHKQTGDSATVVRVRADGWAMLDERRVWAIGAQGSRFWRNPETFKDFWTLEDDDDA